MPSCLAETLGVVPKTQNQFLCKVLMSQVLLHCMDRTGAYTAFAEIICKGISKRGGHATSNLKDIEGSSQQSDQTVLDYS